MILPAPPLFPRKRKPRIEVPRKTTPAALTLVSAEFATDPYVELAFDRAIDIAGINYAAILVDDAGSELRYEGVPDAILVNATTVRIPLLDVASYGGAGTHLTASAATGIVAVDDGGTWAGATDLALPFGA